MVATGSHEFLIKKIYNTVHPPKITLTKLFTEIHHRIESLLGEVDSEIQVAQVRHLNPEGFVHGCEFQLSGRPDPVLVQGGPGVGQPHVLLGPP